jgi:hypothetical protein|tara:strand:+ start:6397 stop:6561 length:165 start_codon:yes stop_codon:yes gene_type:complete
MDSIRKFLKYVFIAAFMTNVGVFCIGIYLSNFDIMILPMLSLPLCLWGVELYGE